MKKNLKDKKSLNIAMLGHKRIPSREGGIEIVVEELSTRMVTLGHKVTCYNRSGHHVSGKDFDGGKRKAYKGVRLKSVLTLDRELFKEISLRKIYFVIPNDNGNCDRARQIFDQYKDVFQREHRAVYSGVLKSQKEALKEVNMD